MAPAIPRKQARWNDWYGNVEATPPHTDRQGRRFPYGRVITGKQHEFTMHPGVLKFLEAQGVQWPPIVVDTSWLVIGHVDEVVNFVPAKTKAGFKVLLPSPKAARDMLQALLAKGLDEEPVFAATEDEMTLGALRMTISQTTENLAIDEAVARLREQLKTELNLEDSDFVMVPALFQSGMAVIPNAVNSVVVNGHLLVPKPLGPRAERARTGSSKRSAQPSPGATCGWSSSIHGTPITRRVARSIAAQTPSATCATPRGGRADPKLRLAGRGDIKHSLIIDRRGRISSVERSSRVARHSHTAIGRTTNEP